ncbi:MAG: aminomethyl-transferring glycine dehydrogenase subunit GcvPB [Oligoflexia bacterium]|nr:aminomethyl-transferring glycine dehydrogenase subunit GcvPB [Oligoflexia bacterium]
MSTNTSTHTITANEILKLIPQNHPSLKREQAPFYIPASDNEIEFMLKTLGYSSICELYKHIPSNLFFDENKLSSNLSNYKVPLSYSELIKHVQEIASLGSSGSSGSSGKISFLGDGIYNYKFQDIVSYILNIRGLTTAYTPYQPERSQGTLQSLWIYSSLLYMLTGFEAINASLYDRSTAIFEAINTAKKIQKGCSHIIVCDLIYPGDKEVLLTLADGTDIKIHWASADNKNGVTDLKKLADLLSELKSSGGCGCAGIVFPQVNSFGNLEDVDAITDLCRKNKIEAIAIIDPMLLGNGGLKPPSKFAGGLGASIIVGEGQHLALPPSFGGPGIGIFGVRYNSQNRMDIRQTPGRYVGAATDINGKAAKTLILSTREQHIRREKASSNICSNQAFIATLVGGSLLARGDQGLTDTLTHSRNMAITAAKMLTSLPLTGVELAFKDTPFFNSFTLRLPENIKVKDFIKVAQKKNIQVGVDVSNRLSGNSGNNNLLLLSFTDIHTQNDLDKLHALFKQEFASTSSSGHTKINTTIDTNIDSKYLRDPQDVVGIPKIDDRSLKEFYTKLGEQNVSPDDNIYALGSCTMKYNPYVNDSLASLSGFTDIHPQAPIEDIQAPLKILFEMQEFFKGITGLAAVTTQPLAGAQGELAGIKMIQAYHKDRGEKDKRNIILILHSAHGTNPATASYAGYESKEVDGVQYGIVEISANSEGTIDFQNLESVINKYNNRIAGIMVTNPNTSGIFEYRFKEMADMIHAVGGLVYMDGANMNAIAGWVDLGKMGVDAVHNNLHKTWSIAHGGGGPGDAIVAVSEKLAPYLPGVQIVKVKIKNDENFFDITYASKSIGSMHRHFGNFLHKVRCYAYVKYLGIEGIRKMSAVAVLSARYLQHHISKSYPTLPVGAENSPRMHEFIITLPQNLFEKIEQTTRLSKPDVMSRIGKIFLDFGIHAPTVSFPEPFGLMIEPTESYTKEELDRFVDIVKAINILISETPEILQTVPHFTPVDKIDEVSANKNPILSEKLLSLPQLFVDRVKVEKLNKLNVGEICKEILMAHKNKNISKNK